MDDMSKSKATDHDLSLDRFLGSFNIVKGQRVPRSHAIIDESLPHIEALFKPKSDVEGLPICVRNGVGGEKVFGFITKMRPFMIVKRLMKRIK